MGSSGLPFSIGEKMKRIFVAMIVISALVFTSCGDVLVKVNGESIKAEELEKIMSVRVQQYEAQGYELGDEEKASIREELMGGLIDQTLLRQKAEEKKVELAQEDVDAQYESFLQQFGDEEEAKTFLEEQGYSIKQLKKDIEVDLLVQNLLEQEIFPEATPSDEEIQQFYNDNPQYFLQPESIHARHILMQTTAEDDDATRQAARQKIEDVQSRLASGEDFAELAIAMSEGPSGPSGGDLGWFSRGQMVPPFEEAAFALEPGEISDIVETSFGYHIIKLEEKKAEGTTPFDEVSESIKDFIMQQALPSLYDSYLTDLKADAEIKYTEVEEAAETEEVSE